MDTEHHGTAKKKKREKEKVIKLRAVKLVSL